MKGKMRLRKCSSFNDLVRVAAFVCFFVSAVLLPAADYFETFSPASTNGWRLWDGWRIVEDRPGNYVLRGSSSTDSFGQSRNVVLGSSWRLEADVRFHQYGADGGRRALTGFSLFPGVGTGVQFEANLGHRTNDSLNLNVQWFNENDGSWNVVYYADWTPSRVGSYHMELTRREGSNRLIFRISSTNGYLYRGETTDVPPALLNRMVTPGFRADNCQVDIDNFRVIQPFQAGPPPVIERGPSNQVAVSGTRVTFRVQAASARPLRYQWYRGTSRLGNATNDIYAIPIASSVYNGQYVVEVEDGDSIVRSAPAQLTVIYASINSVPGTGPDSTNAFALDLNVTPNRAFAVQSSTNLADWNTVTNMVGTGPVRVYPETPESSLHGANRFFRLLIP